MAKKGAGVSQPEEAPAAIEKQQHVNIFEALSAFQAENPSIARTKEFGKEGDKMHWWYAPLDEVLKTVRPLTAKHGLAFTWEQGDEKGSLVCALYHETYVRDSGKSAEKFSVDGQLAEVIYGDEEKNVIRSMPIEVRRKGDMKDIGSDSTYARRTTLAEVLGIAPDEDTDAAQFEDARKEQATKAMFERVKKGIMAAKKATELDASDKVLKQNLADLEAGKIPNLGLTEAELVELGILVESQRKALGFKPEEAPRAPGENEDRGGKETVQLDAPEGGQVPKL